MKRPGPPRKPFRNVRLVLEALEARVVAATTIIPAPAGSIVTNLFLNDSGQVAGNTRNTATEVVAPIYWNLPEPETSEISFQEVLGFDSHGDVVGKTPLGRVYFWEPAQPSDDAYTLIHNVATGDEISRLAVNPSGQVAYTLVYDDSFGQRITSAYSWTKQRGHAFIGNDRLVLGVSSQGDVLGLNSAASGDGFVWTLVSGSGVFKDIDAPFGNKVASLFVNATGQLVGNGERSDFGVTASDSFYVSDDVDEPQTIQIESHVDGISNDGKVVAVKASGVGFVWDYNTRAYPIPSIEVTGGDITRLFINNAGTIAGTVQIGTAKSVFLLNGTEIQTIQANAEALSLNQAGQVVGVTDTGNGFLWSPLSLARSTLSVAPGKVPVGNSATVTLTVRDAAGTPEPGNVNVALALGAGTGQGTLGPVVSQGNGVYTATFSASAAGTRTITATINGQPVSVTPVVTIEPPLMTARNDSAGTNEGTALTQSAALSTLANDTGAAGRTLTVTAVNGAAASVGQALTLASGALVQLNADGSFHYDPRGRFEGLKKNQAATDSFNYTASDGLASANATVTINIAGLNDVPVLDPLADRTLARTAAPLALPLQASDPDGDTLTYQVEAEQIDPLAELDATYGFYMSGGYGLNWGGRQEKWLVAARQNNGWFYLLPDGGLFRWETSFENSTPIATLGAGVHANPSLLHAAEQPVGSAKLAEWNTQHQLNFSGNYWQNWSGANEKWLNTKPDPNLWYYLLPGGELFRWSQSFLASVYIGLVGTAVWDNPALLHDTGALPDPASLTLLDQQKGFRLEVSYYKNTAGLNEVWIYAAAEGGVWYVIVPQGDLYRWKGSLPASDPITHVGSLIWNNPSLLIDAAAPVDRDQLETLNSGHGFYFDTSYWENWSGTLAEKWLQSTVDNSWWYLLPNGSLYHCPGSVEQAVLVANVGGAVWNSPALLLGARTSFEPSGFTLTVNAAQVPALLTIDPDGKFVGALLVTVTLEDGTELARRKFVLTVTR